MTWEDIKIKIESAGIQDQDEIANIELPDLCSDLEWEIFENMGIWQISLKG